MGVGGKRHAPATLPVRKRPGTHCTGGWVVYSEGKACLLLCDKLAISFTKCSIHLYACLHQPAPCYVNCIYQIFAASLSLITKL
jgi:hypothetical protein